MRCLPHSSLCLCLQQPSKLILDTLRSKLFRLTVPQLLAAGTHAPEPEPAPPAEVTQQPEPIERHAGPLQVCEAYGPELKGLLAYDGMAPPVLSGTSRAHSHQSRAAGERQVDAGYVGECHGLGCHFQPIDPS